MISLLPVVANAVNFTYEVINGIDYYLNVDTKEAIVYRSDYSGVIIIPGTVTHEGVSYVVKGIWESAFEECTNVTSITLPNSITSIGDKAFYKCI